MAIKKENDFVGWKTPDGLHTVCDLLYSNGSKKMYSIHCEICSKDTELFPNGFVSSKHRMLNNIKPCGCSKSYKWNAEQLLILAKRYSKPHINIVGIYGEFKGCYTLIQRECLIHKYTWTTAYTNLSKGHDCKKCSSLKQSTGEMSALKILTPLCVDDGYHPLGFLNGYKNARSRFTYECDKHGIKDMSYDNFLHGKRCPDCGAIKSGFYGYLSNRLDEIDTLYVLNFDGKYIKVGRTFNLEQRIKNLKSVSGNYNISVLKLINGTHEYIYSLEQSLLKFLRMYHLSYEVSFTTEAFSNESIDYIYYFIKERQYIQNRISG